MSINNLLESLLMTINQHEKLTEYGGLMPEDQNGQEEPIEHIEEVQGEEQPGEVSTPEEPTEAPQGEELPEDVRDRTREQFEKLKQHNKELSEENKKLKGNSQPIPSVLDYLTPAQVPQYMPQPQQFVPQMPYQPPQVSESQLVDEQGYVNGDVLRRELDEAKKARQMAEQAERRAQDAENRISKFEQDAETKALYQSYPELDPLSEVFNHEAYNLVRNELTSQIVTSGRRDSMKAAENMSKYFRTQAPTKAQEQRKQVATTGTAQYQPSTDFEDLKRRSKNDPNAMLERLERSGY